MKSNENQLAMKKIMKNNKIHWILTCTTVPTYGCVPIFVRSLYVYLIVLRCANNVPTYYVKKKKFEELQISGPERVFQKLKKLCRNKAYLRNFYFLMSLETFGCYSASWRSTPSGSRIKQKIPSTQQESKRSWDMPIYNLTNFRLLFTVSVTILLKMRGSNNAMIIISVA